MAAVGKAVYEDIARGLGEDGVLPAFVEKDYYATRALQVAAAYAARPDVDFDVSFGGGTSLSKRGLIGRFSEDVDLLVSPKPDRPNLTRSHRRAFRKGLLEAIAGSGSLSVHDVDVMDASSNVRIRAAYPRQFDEELLRPHVQVDLRFQAVRLPTPPDRVTSLLADKIGEGPAFTIPMVDPAEIAGDKLSALMWKSASDRGTGDDLTYVRHLHDLAALRPALTDSRDSFREIARDSMLDDIRRGRGGLTRDHGVAQRLVVGYRSLATPAYEAAYETYVDKFSYLPAAERIDFRSALDEVRELSEALAPSVSLSRGRGV